jgi:uncharacterized membrane protein
MTDFEMLLPIEDVVAFFWVLFCWVGYTYIADRNAINKREVAKVMYHHRILWMTRMLERENRMPDVNIVAAHIRSGTLFASTSILILAGSVAILGNVDRLRIVISELSFAAEPKAEILEIKVFVLMGIFVYAFFKYAWCLRQFNFSLILIGAAPKPEDCDERVMADYPVRTAQVLTRATNTFNRGLRAYYFGLASLIWFVQPWMFALSAVWVILVLYRRDYRSQTLDALSPAGGADGGSGF